MKICCPNQNTRKTMSVGLNFTEEELAAIEVVNESPNQDGTDAKQEQADAAAPAAEDEAGNEQCKFVYSRETKISGVVFNKGQRCEQRKAKNMVFCRLHRRVGKIDASSSALSVEKSTNREVLDKILHKLEVIEEELRNIKKARIEKSE